MSPTHVSGRGALRAGVSQPTGDGSGFDDVASEGQPGDDGAQRRGGQARLRNRVMLADRWAAQLGLGGRGDEPQPENPGVCVVRDGAYRRLVMDLWSMRPASLNMIIRSW
jgi:hypothetical protein